MSSAREEYVRKLRNNIYGPNPKNCSDEGWESCKANWMRPDCVIWLENQPQNAQQAPRRPSSQP